MRRQKIKNFQDADCKIAMQTLRKSTRVLQPNDDILHERDLSLAQRPRAL